MKSSLLMCICNSTGDVGVHCDVKAHPSTGTLSTENDIEQVWSSRRQSLHGGASFEMRVGGYDYFSAVFSQRESSSFTEFMSGENVVRLGHNLNSSRWLGMPFPSSRKRDKYLFICDFPRLDISEMRFWIWVLISEKKKKQ